MSQKNLFLSDDNNWSFRSLTHVHVYSQARGIQPLTSREEKSLLLIDSNGSDSAQEP